MVRLGLGLAAGLALVGVGVEAFLPQPATTLLLQRSPSIGAALPLSRASRNGLNSRLKMQTDDYKKYGTEFDLLRGKDFDLLALRQFRREARLRYSNLNQSEPLRILIFGTLAILAGFYPSIAEGLEVQLTPQDRVVAAVTAFFSFAAFLRERGRRTAQLIRMDKESAIGDLGIKLEDPVTGAKNSFELRQMRQKRRVLVVYGDRGFLQESLREAAPYRRRFLQSQVAFVAVSSDGSTQRDWGLPMTARGSWLWESTDQQEWNGYMDDLLSEKKAAMATEGTKGAWLALNLRGRSIGSGIGVPKFDEVLGTKLPPTELLPEEDAPSSSDLDGSVLDALSKFYKALTTGDVETMASLWVAETDESVSEFVELGGRLDPWDSQLRDGARPEGMTIASRDVLVSDDKLEAWTTCLEAPVGANGNTLLASQQWVKEGSDWKLKSHRTIPFSANTGAAAILRCDRRGCVAGLREADRAEQVPSPFVMPSPGGPK